MSQKGQVDQQVSLFFLKTICFDQHVFSSLNHHLGVLWLFFSFLPKIQTNVNDEQLSTWFWTDYLQIISKDVNSLGSIHKGLPFSSVCFFGEVF